MPSSFLFLSSFCVRYVFFDASFPCLARYLQPWITPSLFDNTGNNNIVDEWTFGQLQDRHTAQQKLEAHWDTWITKADFAAIAAAGYVSYDEPICFHVVDEFILFLSLNHVRVPIGYWAWEVGPGEPYIQGQLPYLRNAVNWARAYDLKLVVDLHGVPGSQNGYEHFFWRHYVLERESDLNGHRIMQLR
jgi:glucan 1,3-beta-glucosidase